MPMNISKRRYRGTAEVEVLYCVIFILAIMLLAYAAQKISAARMNAGENAQYLTWHDAYDDPTPQYDNGPLSTPVSGAETLRPESLPNRVYSANPSNSVSWSSAVIGTQTVTVGATAMVPGPTWNLSATPVGGPDQIMLQTWFEDYAQESFGEVATPLGLDPAWYP